MKRLLARLGIWLSVAAATLLSDKQAVALADTAEPRLTTPPDISDDTPVFLERARDLYGDDTTFKYAAHRSHSSHRSHASHRSSAGGSTKPSEPKEESGETPTRPSSPNVAPGSMNLIPRTAPSAPSVPSAKTPPSSPRQPEGLIHSKATSDQHVAQGLESARRGRYDEAMAWYTTALALDPTNFIAHNNMGVALHRKGESVKAKEHLRSSVQINPTYADAYYNMGVILLEEGQKAEALANVQKGCALGLADACKLAKTIQVGQ